MCPRCDIFDYIAGTVLILPEFFKGTLNYLYYNIINKKLLLHLALQIAAQVLGVGDGGWGF